MEYLAQEVLNFWIGDLDAEGMAAPAKQKLWFGKDSEFDKLIQKRFGNYLEPAGMGAFDRWSEAAEGRVAEIILLDQFPRNIFRGHPRSFYYDRKAQHLCLEGLRKEEHFKLPASLAYFLTMPTMHAEDLTTQDIGVQTFALLCERVSGDAKAMLQNALSYAERHRDIIRRFGRFPHRNAILGRPSTESEIEFLKEPGSSF